MKRGAYGSQPRARSATVAVLRAAALGLALGTAGCAAAPSSVAGGFADPLARAILAHDDPETVRNGLPALLLAVDALLEANPQDTGNLLAGARLYATYSVRFTESPERARRLSESARGYAERGACAELAPLCQTRGQPFAQFEAALARVPRRRVKALYALGESWAAWIATHSHDWGALSYGIDPAHLGIIFLANMQIGYITPPVGMNLFIASHRFQRPVLELVVASVPFFFLLLTSVAIITYWPALSLALVHASP